MRWAGRVAPNAVCCWASPPPTPVAAGRRDGHGPCRLTATRGRLGLPRAAGPRYGAFKCASAASWRRRRSALVGSVSPPSQTRPPEALLPGRRKRPARRSPAVSARRPPRAPSIRRVVEQAPQLGCNAGRGVAMARNGAGNTQPRHTLGIVGLVPGAWHDQHRTPRPHRQPGRANSAVVDDGRRPGKQLGERRVIEGRHALRQGGEPVARVFQDEDGPAAEQARRPGAGFIERTGVRGHSRAEREHEGRWAVVPETAPTPGATRCCRPGHTTESR